MITSPTYNIYSETYTNFQQSIAGGASNIEQLIPTRYSSLKSLFLCQRSSICNQNTDWKGHPNTRSTFGLTDYCLRLGSTQIPPKELEVQDMVT